MPNGNTEVIREIREIITHGKPLDIDTRDRLLFTAIIDLYEQIEPMRLFYKVGLFLASGIGASVIALIGGILTGKVEIVFK